jgi:hypothetical protein
MTSPATLARFCKLLKQIAVGVFVFAAIPASAGNPPVVVYFAGTADDAAQTLASLCVNKGIPVIEQDARHVQCANEMSGLSGALTQVLIGNAYSTTPQQVVRFSIIPGKGYASVQAVQWVETQMAFGQVRRTAIDGRKQAERLRATLVGAGASLTPPALVQAPAVSETPIAPPTQTKLTPEVPPKPQIQTSKPKTTPRPTVQCITCPG